MRSPRSRRVVAGLLLAPVLTGCFASGGDTSEDSSDGGSRLRVALAFPPAENFSPYGADATLLSRLGVTEGLTRLDANGAPAPALAESWTRENDRNWLFTLREATFQDGTEVTSAAVATALVHATEAEPVTAALSGTTLTAKANGDRQVRVTTESPDPALPLRLSSPGLVILSAKAYDAKRVNPVGTATGPFELTEVTGTTAATLDRYDAYWGGRAQASGIDARFIADGSARTNALRTDQVDIAESVPVAQASTLDKGTRRETATTRTTSLLLNTESGAFKDPKLRAAAREAVDGSVLAEDVYEGYADAGAGIFGPAVTWAADKRVEPAGRARATDADGTAITIATYDNRPELPEVAQVLQQQLQKAGFKVKLEVREYSRLESDALAGKFDALVGARNSLLDTGDPVSILTSDFTCDGSYNLALLCDKKVDRAVAAAAKESDTAKRQQAAMNAEAAILATDATVPLVHQKIITGVGASVRGVILDPYERTLVGTGTRR
ncbi:ABC transporter substrate-binding protein [Streptomyces scabiei]|uniref:ABC transporter substrate-binding protein n=1 Tax=Streptomyces scabiei TaxID=1930 RepID=UPI000765CA7C|nr:ABC transporter substrate-binding protein [Streptomyces scabiei]MBP5927055.1 ABC transporter substrate-binding protein [Streptomyces sp. LBUM 1479]MDX2536637.1 ABC transporter substrate-binding protein [Streptomyces scabiei]MDX2802457.1 ABC transporter substrate-binding protein [Streptomyces scabiei]MDX2861422.1 ABC transporter substrate-binding protein [Streptomyces scabiei]MDX3826103.1 ABC transporter substrate-binding protein [Streptomyces scabiei]